MIYKSLFLIALFVSTAFAAQPNADGVVSIYSVNKTGRSVGTGFFVDGNGTIVTAYHVIQGASAIEIYGSNNKLHSDPEVLAFDPISDFAVLRVKTRVDSYYSIRDEAPRVMDQLTVIGNPLGFRNQAFRANATQNGFADSKSLIGTTGRGIYTTSIPIIPLDATVYDGMSGAPLFNSNGSVIAIVVASLNIGGSLAWGIPAKQFLPILQNAPKSGKRSSQVEWQEISSIAHEARSFSIGSRLSALETIDWINSKWRSSGAKEVFFNGFRAKILEAEASISDDQAILQLKIRFEYVGDQYRFLIKTQLRDAEIAKPLPRNSVTQRYPFRIDCPDERSCVSVRMEKLAAGNWHTLQSYEKSHGSSELWSFIDSDSAQRTSNAVTHLIHLNGGPVRKKDSF